jgi:hypothetical protein
MNQTFLTKLMRHSMILAMVLSLGWFATPSQATLAGTVPLAPGSVFPFPPDVSGNAPGILLADQVQSFSTVVPGKGIMSGSIESAVYQEGPGGTLDFYYQMNNTSPDGDSFDRNTDGTFTGFATNVGYRIDGVTLTGTTFSSSTFFPVQADRKPAGDVVGFTFNGLFTPDEDIPVGASSAVLVISTDAHFFTIGSASAIDGGTGTVAAFEPTNVPEPMSFMLLGSGLLCLGLLRRKNRKA